MKHGTKYEKCFRFHISSFMNKIKNITEASNRIKQAVENKEKIILYGDSDLDGIASAVILEEAIKNIGGKVSAVIFPNRENDGYGINMKSLKFLKEKSPALLVTLDLGISNLKEVKTAREMGFDVVIIDHHEPLEMMPDANIIVNPHQKGDDSGFKYLCNAGLTFKVVEEILSDFSEKLKNSFIELVALATISDMVPQINDNNFFIERGLRSLLKTFRPGLNVFLDILGIGEVSSGGFAKIISALNASESTNFTNQSYALLTSSSKDECREITENLLAKVKFKQQKIKEIVQEVESRISLKKDELIIFEGDISWKLILAGSVASIIASKYEKPTFIMKKGDDFSAGSVRSLKEGQNSVEAMKACKDLLISYGGHAKASGFRIRTENLEQFRHCLTDYFRKQKQ